MPTRPHPLPAELGDAFTTAQALDLGIGRGMLRRTERVTRGVRSVAPPTCLADRCRALALVLPDEAAFSHATAARLHGLWLPASTGDDIEVLVPPGVRPPRRRGVVARVGRCDTMRLDGVTLARPPDVFAQVASGLGVRSLAVLGDSVVRWRSSWTVADLDTVLVPGARGVRRARHALRLVRPGSNSPRESLLRILLLDAGLPEPELNGRVVSGARREIGDLLWRRQKVVCEYHGHYHYASDGQRLADIDRSAWFRRLGWTVIEVTKTHLASRAAIDDLIDELAVALGVVPLGREERGRTYGEPESASRYRKRTLQGR